MRKPIAGWVCTLLISFNILAQAQSIPVPSDTSRQVSPQPQAEPIRPTFRLSTFVVPATLLTAGLLTQGQFSREVRDKVVRQFPGFTSPLDDYLQYAPSAVVLGLGAAGVKGRHPFTDQLAILVLSNVVSQGITQTLKYTVAYPRPDGNGQESFPSGHTTNAFTGATVLAHEYGGRSAWYTVGGYVTATTVAGFRVIKNRHWLADVLFGAGVGIGSAELIYGAYPWLKHLVIHRKQTVLVPMYQGNALGLCLVSVF